MTEADRVPAGVDATRPSPARMYDYMLGGTHNFQVDRDATDRFRAQMPELEDAAWANRGFHGRAVRCLTGRGISQFIDIGSGLPTQNNTHQVLAALGSDARVLYADIDPMVLAIGSELLANQPNTALIDADLRAPGSVLEHPALRALIDLSQPVGLLMTAVLHFVADDDDPWGLVKQFTTAMPTGSYLALSHITGDRLPPRLVRTGVEVYRAATENAHPRSKAQVERFFEGLELLPPYPGAGPAVTYVGIWGAEDPVGADSDGSRAIYCGVARRP